MYHLLKNLSVTCQKLIVTVLEDYIFLKIAKI